MTTWTKSRCSFTAWLFTSQTKRCTNISWRLTSGLSYIQIQVFVDWQEPWTAVRQPVLTPGTFYINDLRSRYQPTVPVNYCRRLYLWHDSQPLGICYEYYYSVWSETLKIQFTSNWQRFSNAIKKINKCHFIIDDMFWYLSDERKGKNDICTFTDLLYESNSSQTDA